VCVTGHSAPPPPTRPPLPPSGPTAHHPPKWAWWVVGILIPTVAIAVSVFRANQSSEGHGSTPTLEATSKPSTNVAARPSPSVTTSSEATEAEAKRYFGPGDVSFDEQGGGYYLDFDSKPPLLTETSTGGTDLVVESMSGAPEAWNEHIAPLSGSGPSPSETECAEQVTNRSTYYGDLTRGARFCFTTDEGRTVYFRTVAAPVGEGLIKLMVTVWDTPD
jgi:hypothetical protein